MYTAVEIKKTLNCNALLHNNKAALKYLAVDSRRISFPEETLFFAIKTINRDGHIFIDEVYEQGVRNFVVNENSKISKYPEANLFFVSDTLFALQTLSAEHRKKFTYPIIGITGSNGKTIVKEWLFQLLNEDYKIVRNPRSYNSQIGVPLSVWEMDAHHNLAIFEAGISEKKEMQPLTDIIRPDIGILTNIGKAHEKNFIDDKEKLQEKLLLFKNVKTVFAFYNDTLIRENLPKLTSAEIFSIGFERNCTLYIKETTVSKKNTVIKFIYNQKKIIITTPFTDAASLHNSLICIAVCLYFEIDTETIQQRVNKLQPLEMRLQVIPGINGSTFINDSYSLDLKSLDIALDFLTTQPYSKSVIISDIPQADEEAYKKAVYMLRNKHVNQLIAIGTDWNKYKDVVQDYFSSVQFYNSTQEFINHFNTLDFRNKTVLIKGARKFLFENIIPLFQQKIHNTFLEINLSAIIHNLKVYRKHLLPVTKLMAMVKAFGYGSGSLEIASLLQFHKVDYLTVAYTDEAVELKEAGIQLPIMVMNVDESSFGKIIDYGLEPEIFSFNILKQFTAYIQQEGLQAYPVHIKIDTGMHRLGFEKNDIPELAQNLKSENTLHVKSVFSHLVASEDKSEDHFTQQQVSLFEECCFLLESELKYKFLKHISNSAGILRHPSFQFDMVRLGIGLYGLDSSESKVYELQPALSFKTTIAQIKYLKAGETVGYNRKGLLKKDSIIATIRVGYADGFKRMMSNGNGAVYVKGKLAPVVGIVCMDMTMIDITDIEDVHEEDIVEIFGTNLPVEKFAEWCNTNTYEILTGIGNRVRRIYTEE